MLAQPRGACSRLCLLPSRIIAVRFLANLTFALLLPLVAVAATETSKQAAVDALLTTHTRPDAPGAAVGVYQGGRVLYAKGFGVANLQTGTPITAQTQFHISSVSKQFTAFAIALLARAGKVDLDADVGRYLPGFPKVGQVVTPRHLIHHMSGVREQYELIMLTGRDLRDLVTGPQLVQVLEQQRSLNFAPGTDFLYGNSAYTLLAQIVEAVSGQTFREFTTQHMFAPLGMKRTFFADDWREVIPGRASHYENVDGRWLLLRDGVGGVGPDGLLTTVEDLAHWADNFARPRVGDAALIDLISRSGQLNDGSAVHYGFGLFDTPQRGRKAISHLGVDLTVMSFFVYYPEHDLGIAVLSNSDVEVTGVALDIADIYLPPVKVAATKASRPLVSPQPAQFDRLVGTYVTPGLPALLLERAAERLTMRQVGDKESRALILRRDGSFDGGSPASEYFRPSLDPSAAVTGFDRIRAAGAAIHYRRVERVRDAPSQLAKLAGKYHSDELDVTYEFGMEGDQLVARSLWRAEPVRLVQITASQFDSDAATLRRSITPHSFTFEFDSTGAVSGVLMHSARVRNVEMRAVQ